MPATEVEERKVPPPSGDIIKPRTFHVVSTSFMTAISVVSCVMGLGLALAIVVPLLLDAVEAKNAQESPAECPPSPPSPPPTAVERSTLEDVLARGHVNCGVGAGSRFFSYLMGSTWYGFDVDLCRAVAAAVFADPRAVDFTTWEGYVRFEGLRFREIDILSRTTTNTLRRRNSEDVIFATTTLYDGQGFMVAVDLNVSSFEGLDKVGTTLCATAGSTTLTNLRVITEHAEVMEVATTAESLEVLLSGNCDALSGDRLTLASLRASLATADQDRLVILADTKSKEPLSPVVLNTDLEWANIVNAVVNGMIIADEYGLRASNVQAALQSDDTPAEARRMLGMVSNFAHGLPLPPDFMVSVLKLVGSYADIYDVHLVANGYPREGLNRLWTDGGALYAFPWS